MHRTIEPAILSFGTPVIMNFQQCYGLAPGRLHESTLARISEDLYRVS